jgi:hypothetical protein
VTLGRPARRPGQGSRASKPAERPVQSLVASLRPLLRSRKARLTLGEIVARVEGEGEGGLGPVLFVLTLPVLLPLPPGVSTVLALPLLVISSQIIAGRRSLWLPRALARKSVKRPALVKLLQRVLPMLERLEKMSRPRLGLLTGSIGTRVVGIACTVIALVLILPIPFANLVPALALGVFSLALTRKDGVLVLVGFGLLAIAAAVIALGVHGISRGFVHLRAVFEYFRGLSV